MEERFVLLPYSKKVTGLSPVVTGVSVWRLHFGFGFLTKSTGWSIWWSWLWLQLPFRSLKGSVVIRWSYSSMRWLCWFAACVLFFLPLLVCLVCSHVSAEMFLKSLRWSPSASKALILDLLIWNKCLSTQRLGLENKAWVDSLFMSQRFSLSQRQKPALIWLMFDKSQTSESGPSPQITFGFWW